jgi:hypothetical protein
VDGGEGDCTIYVARRFTKQRVLNWIIDDCAVIAQGATRTAPPISGFVAHLRRQTARGPAACA